MEPLPNDECARILNVWRAGQTQLPLVVRWGQYSRDGSGTRVQDCLQHSYSLTLLARVFIEKLRPYITLGSELFLTAALVHDHGEGEIGKDTLYIDKSIKVDLAEYEAFCERFNGLGPALFAVFQRAFLLQFALVNPANFPLEARDIMRELAAQNRYEALAFEGLEHWNYILYAIEQYREYKNEKILVQVLRNSVPHLRELTTLLPGFGATIFTQEVYDWCLKFISAREGKWIEEKGV